MSETLYNGIKLPDLWPPSDIDTVSRKPLVVPYLNNPPSVIPIDVGRQLFVDDFLIGETTLTRTFHQPEYFAGNPILIPETELEMNGGVCPVATPFNDGVLYDERDGLFKMWYHAGWFDGIGYATSKDGIHWIRPKLDIEPDTNRVLPKREGYRRDGVSVWIDHETEDEKQRFKMFAYFRSPDWKGGEVYTSSDGIHWSEPTRTGHCGDNTNFFYNPFRKKWVFSIRAARPAGEGKERIRRYLELDDFIRDANWSEESKVFWAAADELDLPHMEIGDPAQLYSIDAVAYESVMLGLFQLHQGPSNKACEESGLPKFTDIQVAFSRDGFYFDRRNRNSFFAPTEKKGDWNRAYIHSAGGCCIVVGDELYFYVGGWSGISPQFGTHMYAGGSTGLAKLRRDGFASMDAGELTGHLTTRPLRFSGKYLFVNVSTPHGLLTAEVLDENNRVIPAYSRENCVPISLDKTRQQIVWKSTADLTPLSNKTVKLKFHLTNGELYAFWISPHESGASYGYLAGGSPGINGLLDRPVS